MSTPSIRFRYSAALAVAGLIATLGGLPLLAASPYFAFVLLVPLSVAYWGWRAGTDADERGLTVRALVGRRFLPWSQVDALYPDGRRVHARLANGGVVTLLAVTPADLPTLVEAGGADQPTTDRADQPAADRADQPAAERREDDEATPAQ